ncbi:MAG TPA: transcription elongation factor GreA [Candidatus Bathyarchaeia archaeon]|nr:transcription elongation factor GreA [Candidatus Bathyarchaeia archaeon]
MNKIKIPQKIHLTTEGLNDLKSEFVRLKDEKRPEIVERLAVARDQGDLSENQEYSRAREDLALIDGRIDEIRDVIANAVVIKGKGSNGECVGIGSKVTVQLDNQEIVFHLVGEWEADPSSQKISHKSPLGQKLLGKKSGAEVEVEAPIGKLIYRIIRIE